MKKKTMILLTAVLCASVGALVMFLNRPYKPVSFTVDGDQWSAKTVDGGSLLLELHNDNKSREWSIVSEPETFVSDYHNIAENISEFHIIALEDGNGEMVFQCVKMMAARTCIRLDFLFHVIRKPIFKLIQLPSKFPGV